MHDFILPTVSSKSIYASYRFDRRPMEIRYDTKQISLSDRAYLYIAP